MTRDSTCRAEILAARGRLESRTGRDSFSPMDILREMEARGTSHPESTIRTHITSAMCVEAPKNHPIKYDDIERVGHGRYRLLESR